MARAPGQWTASHPRKGSHDRPPSLAPARGGLRRLHFAALLSLLGPVALAVGCGLGGSQPYDPPGQGGTGGAPSLIPCKDGDVRDCHLEIGEHAGVLTCYSGTQTCVGGTFGPCGNGTVVEKTAPPKSPEGTSAKPGLGPLSFSDAGPCVDNPCDPTCQVYDEQPPVGGIVTPTPWVGGGLVGMENYAPGLVKKGFKEPCHMAADCQFNHRCENPITESACGHNKCAPGAALDFGCDPCVDLICAQDPTCCNFAGSCAHDPCVQGVGLKKNCDPCVDTICAAQPSCCSGSWDASCVNLTKSLCGQSCNATWSQSCADKVHDVCGAFCNDTTNSCAHNVCYSGAPLIANCDTCVSNVCQQRPSCCTTAWDDTCVGLVQVTCGTACPPQGQCEPWVSGETDPKCNGIDLTLNIPCSKSKGQAIPPQVPVCNVGTQTAPAGIQVVAYPANSPQYPQCTPTGNNPTYCPLTTVPILPGKCIDLECAALNGSEELVVNPPGPNYVAECQCGNNWAIFQNNPALACEPPFCNGAQTGSLIKPPYMFFAVERSNAIDNTTFGELRTALGNFFNMQQSTSSNQAYASLGFFPDKVANNNADCDINTCDPTQCKERVGWAPIPSSASSFVSALSFISPSTEGAPTSSAYTAALDQVRSQLASNPGGTGVVVLVLASQPQYCNPSIVAMAGEASFAWVQDHIQTNVLGIGVPQSVVDVIATAGGGKGFSVSPGAGSSTAMFNALKSIRMDMFPCEFDLPAPDLFDPNNPYVGYTPSSSYTPTPLTFLSSAAQCGDGYYYDNPQSPSKIILCPTTCQTVNLDLGGFVRVKMPCPAGNEKQVYEGVCPGGTHVQWGYFAYDTTIPLDNSKVNFQVRTADTQAGLASTSFINLATAQSQPTDTQLCPLTGPAPCPVDLYNALGGLPGASNQFLELSISLSAAGTTSPMVNNWQITYSCPPSE